jgi:N-acetylmuramoyl-L-alanine amidase
VRLIDLIVIHCSATRPGLIDKDTKRPVDVNAIRRWHRARDFLDVGYHYVIPENGELQEGRPLAKVGAHAEGYNAKSIGICMVGGVNAKGKAENNFNGAQLKTLKSIVYQLKCLHPDARICGHRDLPKVNKDCPSFDVKTWLKEVGLASE